MSSDSWELFSNQAVAACACVYFLAVLAHLWEWALLRRAVPVSASVEAAVPVGVGAGSVELPAPAAPESNPAERDRADLFGRIGGEEFALILPDTSLAAAARVAERLRLLTESEVVSIADTHVRFTASFGVAQYGIDGDSFESVIEAADSRMYRAKQAGRNQVIAE